MATESIPKRAYQVTLTREEALVISGFFFATVADMSGEPSMKLTALLAVTELHDSQKYMESAHRKITTLLGQCITQAGEDRHFAITNLLDEWEKRNKA